MGDVDLVNRDPNTINAHLKVGILCAMTLFFKSCCTICKHDYSRICEIAISDLCRQISLKKQQQQQSYGLFSLMKGNYFLQKYAIYLFFSQDLYQREYFAKRKQ